METKLKIERLTNIPVWEGELDRYMGYSLEDLRVLAEETFPRQYNTVFPDNKLVFSNYKFEIDTEWDYDVSKPVFKVKYYREETDDEYKKRCEILWEIERKAAENEKMREADRLAKIQKAEALRADPDYQTFLKLKNKFNGI